MNHTGTNNPNSKLNWSAVTYIRKHHTLPASELAERYNVTAVAIYQIRAGISWPEGSRPGSGNYKRRKKVA